MSEQIALALVNLLAGLLVGGGLVRLIEGFSKTRREARRQEAMDERAVQDYVTGHLRDALEEEKKRSDAMRRRLGNLEEAVSDAKMRLTEALVKSMEADAENAQLHQDKARLIAERDELLRELETCKKSSCES